MSRSPAQNQGALATQQSRKALSLKHHSALSLIFFFSGFSALLYQVSWQRLLTVYYGVGPISIALIVTIFMFGLGIGGYVGGKLAERAWLLPQIYAGVELALGLFGLASLQTLDSIGQATAGTGYTSAAMAAAAFLALPTLLMGATLPLVVKFQNIEARSYLHSVSSLYFVNTLGAAVGALVSSYVIFSLWSIDTAVYVAVFINVALAVSVVILFRHRRAVPGRVPHKKGGELGTIALVLSFVTGFLALGYQIIWYEVLAPLLRSSAYVFSTTLATYLFGIAFGSALMTRWGRRLPANKRVSLFFLLQFLIAISATLLFSGLASNALSVLKDITLGAELHPPSIYLGYGLGEFGEYPIPKLIFYIADVFFWPIFLLFIPTMLMGASFPLAAFLYAGENEQEAASIGRFYLANVLGNVAGSFATAFLLIPELGAATVAFLFALVGATFLLGCGSIGSRRVPFLHVLESLSLCLRLSLPFFHGMVLCTRLTVRK
jgi:spermidine synthase